MIAGELLDVYDVSRHRVVLDVGGGDGSFLSAVALRAPAARLMLFDLPAVAAQAGARFAQNPRFSAHGGDFTVDRLPAGADLITLVRVLHDHDDGKALVLLGAVHSALEPGGVLLLGEPMAGAAGAEPIGAAYFGFYLWAMGSGRARRPDEIAALLRAAGFTKIQVRKTSQPMLTGLITAEA